MKTTALFVKPNAGKTHVRCQQGKVVSVNPWHRSSLNCAQKGIVKIGVIASLAVFTAHSEQVSDVTALTNAVATALEGGVVEIAAGTYQLDEAMVLNNKKVALKGATGNPADVIIDGQDKTRCLYHESVGTDMEIVVSGITFRNARYTGLSNYGGMQSFGGAIRISASFSYACDSGIVVSNCVFESCHSDYGGGGAVCLPGGATITDCVFTNCTAMMKGADTGFAAGGNRGGGAIYGGVTGADTEITRCAFTACSASNGVGVIVGGSYGDSGRINGYSFKIRDCVFTNNFSYGYAGCLGLKAREVEKCVFKGNKSFNSVSASGSAVSGYGGVWVPELNLVTAEYTTFFRECIFEENEADKSGACLYNTYASPVVVTGCVFRANAGRYEGLVALFSCAADLFDCAFERNYHKDEATLAEGVVQYTGFGVLRLTGAANPKRVHRCQFIANRSFGGAGCISSFSHGVEVVNCEFRANTSNKCGFPGPLVHIDQAVTNAVVRGCLFACNTNLHIQVHAVYIGPLNNNNYNYAGGTNAVLENCTFVGNRGNNANWKSLNAGTVFIGNSGLATIRNCVFHDNTSIGGATGIRNFALSSLLEVKNYATYCWENGTQLVVSDETHNILGTDPKFVDYNNGDYRLVGGACVNTGLNSDWMAGAFDLDGRRRIIQNTVDRGCYERVAVGTAVVLR